MLSFMLSGKHITYTETYALILDHNKYITVTDLRIFRNSYNKVTYIIILVTNLYFFRYLVYSTELILITNLYLLRSYTDDRLILIPISRRTHTYACIRRILIQVSQMTYISELILILIHILVLISISDLPRSLQNLCLYRDTLRYYKAYTYTIGLILILRRLHLFGGTRRYYRDITEHILVLRNLSLYGSTRKYYKTYTCTTKNILALQNLYLYY